MTTSPVVIAHRGASGYRPENTLAAFELGLSQGADGIEFDLVCSKDAQLVIRHENTLGTTTDIESRQIFAEAKRQGIVDGKEVSDWFTEDFDLEQIKQLRAIERVAEIRPGSAKFDGEFEIPTFREVLNLASLESKLVVAEIKAGSHLNALPRPIWEIVADDLESIERKFHLVVESFNLNILQKTKQELSKRGVAAQYFYLLDRGSPDKDASIAAGFSGISISLEMLFSDPEWVSAVHNLGKKIWAYTARAESADSSIEAYYEEIIQSGVDGIFADQPDLLRRVLQDSRGSAYDY